MIKVKLKVPAGEAKSGPPLAPILGQHQINLMEFCKLFNSKSLELYSQGTPVRLRVIKGKGSLQYIYKPLTFYSLVMNFCLYTNKQKFLSYGQLYDILVIRLINLEKLGITTERKQKVAKELFGFLYSLNILIKP